VRQRRAIRRIQAPRSRNHFHAFRVNHVSGAEQNSALMGGCWSKMDSDDNRNVISDRKDEYSDVFKDEREANKMIRVTWSPVGDTSRKTSRRVFSVRFAPDPQQALAVLIELVNRRPKLPFFPGKSPRPRGRQPRSSPAAQARRRPPISRNDKCSSRG
jgi:hypothetical protein